MATKYQTITRLYETTVLDVTNTIDSWTAFLRSACRNYKCRFDEQILIYAQRPEATAVLEIEKWNKNFGRWVNKGATGIAVFDDDNNGSYRLKHYFDISDTHGSRFERPVPVWQMEQRYEADVIESLENSFGELENKSTFAEALISVAQNVVTDNLPDYLSELMYCREDSFLEELDSLNVEVFYRTALQNSVAYMLLTRCGIDADDYLPPEDFRYIAEFNTRQTVNALGIATSDIAETCLREISATVLSFSRQENIQNRTFANVESSYDNLNKNENERSSEYGSVDIQNGERLQSAESDRAGGTGSNPWQVRTASQTVSETAPQNIVRESADGRDTEPTLDGNRADGYEPIGTTDGSDGASPRRDGADESRKSDAVGGHDEQHQTDSGGNDFERPDLHLKPLPTVAHQMSMFGEAEEQANASKPSAFSISQQIIDEVLTSGSNEQNSPLRIVAYFKKDHTLAENTDFLKKEYKQGGKGFIFGGNHISIWFNESGLHIANGETALNVANPTLVTWEQAAGRIRELLDMGRYMPKNELDKVDGVELKTLADNLWYLRGEIKEGVESILDTGMLKGGFPDSAMKIATLMADPKERQTMLEGIQALAEKYNQDPDVLRFPYAVRYLRYALNTLSDLQREPLVFTADESVSTARPGFITQDEVDRLFIGGANIQDSKFRIYSYFLQPHTAKEKSDFLKDEYGTGGGGRIGFQEWHDSKGIVFSRENNHMPYDKVTLPWPKVARRIDELIADGRYMSRRELDHIPEYEKGILAAEIYTFYYNQPEEVPHPFPRGADYHAAINAVRPQLESPERVAEILNGMTAILDNTAEFDRRYETMQKAFEDLTAYQNGTFSLFKPVQKPIFTEIQSPQEPERDNPQEPQQLQQPTTVPNVEYNLKLGETVYIGTTEYEIYSFDDTHVVLQDSSALLFTRDMPRDEFDRKLRENSLNDHLRVISEVKGTPMWQDYLAAKAQYPNCIVLYQVGDFYEFFGEDAKTVANILNITITPRDMGIDERVAMCGIPSHTLDENINKLTESGYEIALSGINEQTGKREVLHIISPDGQPTPEPEQPYTPKIGDRYEIQGRQFVVDSVDVDWETVSLKDITFQSNVGFPIFRSESLDFIRMYDPIRPEPKPPTQNEQSTITEETITPLWEQAKQKSRTHSFDPHPEISQDLRHNYRITNDGLGAGGAKTKYQNNVAAIRTLKAIESENRFATPEEQEILAQYVGWGGLPQAFDPENKQWADEYTELNALLSPKEYDSARASTLNAHYTSPTVIKAIYKAVENMGFKTGNILEPSCGIGNFLGLLPESMSESKLFGVEIDSITGRIAQQLYQKHKIAIQGFEETDLPDSFFDLAIGNVPFGSYSIPDKRYDKHKFLIHDYFFARTLDKVRPGGIVAFVTSKGTLDKQNPAVRRYIAQRAELLGAIRLPNTAFKANAGTEVTSDIIFLQKRDRIVDIEPAWVHLGLTENEIPVNSYYAEHPDMILGTMTNESGLRMYGNANDTSCVPFPDSDLGELLADAITNIHGEITEFERDDDEPEEDNPIPADPTVRNFSYTLVDGQIYFRQNSRMIPPQLPVTTQNRIKGMIGLRESVSKLIEYQTEDYPDSQITAEQSRLNHLYDDFVKKYGLINSRGNSIAFSQDSAYCLLCSLEVLDENGELERKADMFSKRTIKPHIEITHVDTASEALAVSLAEKAKVDLPFMSQLTGMPPEEIVRELEGVIFYDFGNPDQSKPAFDPQTMQLHEKFPLVAADEYLSGNVREKLKKIENFIDHMGDTFQGINVAVNLEALKRAVPKDLTAPEISVRLGATWLPEDVVERFMFELLQTPGWVKGRMRVHYSQYTGEWNIAEKSADRSNIHTYNTYGTQRISAYKIIEESLNLRDVRIFDKVYDADGTERRVINKRETAIAQAKQELIRSKFEEWIWQDPARRERLCKMYNEKFNSIRPREYDGSHIRFSGINPEISLRKHQVDAIAHILYGGNTLLAHEVGAGKTYEIVAAAMESKRLGLCSKSLIVVPNHIIEQWGAEFLQLYPSASILVATKRDFEPKNRKKFCARIATGDYDAVIIGHSQFEKIPMSVERQERMLHQQIEELVDGIDEVKRNRGERFTIKQMERTKKGLELRLQKLNDQSRKDDVVTFEQLGVDRLFIDEAHYFKNLFLMTKMRNVGGIAQVEAQKSSDLFMKCRYLDELTGSRGTVFATGTPISNSMVELYTMQRYLQYDSLVRNDLQHFDAWASTFGETVTAIELAPEGTGYRAKTRFAKFFNLPELMSMFKMTADIQTADMLNLPVPKAVFHTEVIKPSQWQQDMVAELAERAERIRNRQVEPAIDNMLKVTNDGRKLALDQRLLNEMLPDDENGKTSVCANNVFRIWEETKGSRSAQLVFSDLSTPKGDGKFNVYEDIQAKLIAKGIPAEEIAFIHSADTEVKKKELFAKVRKGQVRVLIGSTPKMGAGTNVQDRLIALHDCDCPWRPSDLAQRLGRIVRQGNRNPEVQIFRYVTEGTFDSYLYQLVENKQKFIAQIMTSKTPVRSAEDVDSTALSYAEIKALATGNPLIIEKCQLEMDVGKLKILQASHLSQRYALEDKLLKAYPQEIKRLTERITGYKADIETVAKHPANKDLFPPMKIGGILYAEKAEAGKAIIEACKAMTSPDPVSLGEYRGFQMILSFDTYAKEYRVTLSGVLSHTVKLGTDIHGNITRLDNALEGFADSLKNCEEQLSNTQTQMEAAKSEVNRPFAQEQEFAEKSARLKELNILLNMDEKDNEILDYSPDEGDIKPAQRGAERER